MPKFATPPHGRQKCCSSCGKTGGRLVRMLAGLLCAFCLSQITDDRPVVRARF